MKRRFVKDIGTQRLIKELERRGWICFPPKTYHEVQKRIEAEALAAKEAALAENVERLERMAALRAKIVALRA
jgi:streptomycin 6-kinase